MKKTFELKDLGCANCAAKMEREIAMLDGVESVRIDFMRQRMILEASEENFDKLLKNVQKTMRRIEPDVSISR